MIEQYMDNFFFEQYMDNKYKRKEILELLDLIHPYKIGL